MERVRNHLELSRVTAALIKLPLLSDPTIHANLFGVRFLFHFLSILFGLYLGLLKAAGGG